MSREITQIYFLLAVTPPEGERIMANKNNGIKKVKRIGQAVKVLSSFNLQDVDYCGISIYFATESGRFYCISISSYNEEHVRVWGKKEWRERISDGARWYIKNGYQPTRVASITIRFRIKGQDMIEDLLYTIEMTDLSNGLFDRLVIHPSWKSSHDAIRDAVCTARESSSILGARDVVKLVGKIPQVRINIIPTDLPKCRLII